MCLHIQHIDVETYQKAKIYQRNFLTPDQFRNIFLRMPCMMEGVYIYMLFKLCVGAKIGNFSI